jgi:hypothetical protein
MNNDFECEINALGETREVDINKVKYNCTQDGAAIAHALMCIDATIDRRLELIYEALGDML